MKESESRKSNGDTGESDRGNTWPLYDGFEDNGGQDPRNASKLESETYSWHSPGRRQYLLPVCT